MTLRRRPQTRGPLHSAGMETAAEALDRQAATLATAAGALSHEARQSVLARRPDGEAARMLESLHAIFGGSVPADALLEQLRQAVREQAAAEGTPRQPRVKRPRPGPGGRRLSIGRWRLRAARH